MSRWKRRVLIGMALLVGMIIAIGVFIASLDQEDVKRYASAAVSRATGRRLTIAGDINFDFGWKPRLRAEQLILENAPWSSRPRMIEAGLIDLKIDLWPALKGRLVLPSVKFSQLEGPAL